MKRLKASDKIFVVAIIIEYEGYKNVAAFKTKNAAKAFIASCKNVFTQNPDEEIIISKNCSIDSDNVKNLGIVDIDGNADGSIPFFNK